jgi:archaeal cell division control protein 6
MENRNRNLYALLKKLNTNCFCSKEGFDMSKQVSIYDVINKKRLFKNKLFLKPNHTLKSLADVLHRNGEIKDYYEFMKDIFDGVSPNNLFIYGKPGLGKTLLTKLVFEEIKREAENQGIDLLVITINCDEAVTEHSILQKIVEQFPTPNNEPKKKLGYSIGRHNDYLHYLIDQYPGIIVFVLDELDKAESPEMINKIIRIESKVSGQFPTVVGITNDSKLKDSFPPQLKSVLCENSLIINPYDAEQLLDIINARIEIAFHPGVIDGMVTPLCAAFAAQEHGDVRRAIDLLRVGGEIAEREGADIVTENDIRRADELIELNKTIEIVKTLPTQSKVALLSAIFILEHGAQADMNAVYSMYKRMCNLLDIDILTQRRITDLLDELMQLRVIEGDIFYKGRYGRKKVILKVAEQKLTRETLLEDYRLKSIADTPKAELFSFFRKIIG